MNDISSPASLVETKYTVYHPDGKTEDHSLMLQHDPGYDALKKIMARHLGEGNWLEHVTVLHDGKPKDMFVDEEGLLKGLPVNIAATEIYHTYSKQQNPSGYAAAAMSGQLSPIVGVAILFHRRVWF